MKYFKTAPLMWISKSASKVQVISSLDGSQYCGSNFQRPTLPYKNFLLDEFWLSIFLIFCIFLHPVFLGLENATRLKAILTVLFVLSVPKDESGPVVNSVRMVTLVILKVSMELPDANVENVNAQETLIWALSETATEQLGNVSDVSMIQPDSIVRNVNLASLVMLLHPKILEIQRIVNHVNVIHLAPIMLTIYPSVTASQV